jgi:hypothetical protein
MILDAELAKPSVGQIDLDLSAEPALGTKRKYVAHNQHPDHEHRINRRPASVRVEWSELVVHPTQVKQTIDLPYQVIRWHHPVEIKGVKELALTAFLPP